MSIDVSKIHPSIGLVTLKLTATAFLGFTVIFILDKPLFETLDIFRLCVIAMPLPIALSFLHSLFIYFAFDNLLNTQSTNVKTAIIIGSVFTDLIILLSIIGYYVFPKSYKIFTGLIVFEVVVLSTIVYKNFKSTKKDKILKPE